MNPLSKIITIIAVLIILLAGVLPSIIQCNWEWFGRSGALLTAYGITITYLDVAGFLNKISEYIAIRMDEAIESADTSGFSQEEIEKKKNDILNSIKKSVMRTEFMVLTVGTLIWGYGDKLN